MLEIIAALEAAGIKPIVLTPEVTAHGAVETYEDAKKCAALFKSHAADIDGLIITLPNFGEERGLADAIRLADLRVPVLIQATPDAPAKMSIAHRRDSFCGKMSICNNLTQYGIPYSLTTLHTEAPDSPEFASDLAWFAAVCRVVRGLKNLRIGAIGARPTAFNTVRYSEKLLERSGITVETLDLSEVIGRIAPHEGHRRRSASQARRHQKIHPRRRHARSRPAQDGQARRGHRRMDEGQLRTRSVTAVQCWTSIEEFLGIVPCTVMSMMSEDLFASACEVDVLGTLSMHALALASQTPSALLDWNNNYGADPDKAVCFHCSNLPKTLLQPRRKDGLSAHHRRHGRQGRTPTARSTAASRPAP